MRVSARHAFMALGVLAVGVVMGLMAPAPSYATSYMVQHDPCCAPPPPPCCEPPPPPCCNHGGGHDVNVPNITIHGPNINVGVNVNTNVNVNNSINNVINNNISLVNNNNNIITNNIPITNNVNAIANAVANATGGAGGQGGGGGGGGIVIGGSYYANNQAPAATAITGLNVGGLTRFEYESVEEERTRWIEEWRVVRAVCVDDRGTPHPASRPDADQEVPAAYDGEIFRCMAGTAMQVTIGWWADGHENWEEAPTIMCRKGEALRHTPGGRLYCAQQEARRNCNERSLLRLHGPGIKLVFMRREEVYTETVQRRREVAVAETSNMTLMLDGGVGGYR